MESMAETLSADIDEERMESPSDDTSNSTRVKYDSSESEDELFEVEKIMGMSKVGGKVMYKVRWRNYGSADDTWEPIENLQSCLDLIDEFEKKKGEEKKKRAEERKRKKAIMEGKVLSEDESSRESIDPDSDNYHSTFKNAFWKDLEQGKLNLFTTDMYSRVKGAGGARASRPTCLKDTFKVQKNKQEEFEKKPRRHNSDIKEKKKVKSPKLLKERDKGKARGLHNSKKKHSRVPSDSEDGFENTDIEVQSTRSSLSEDEEGNTRDSYIIERQDTHDDITDLTSLSTERMPVLKIKKLKDSDQDSSGDERLTKKKEQQKSSNKDKYTKVKSRTENKESTVELYKSKVKPMKMEDLKKSISPDKPPSPIKSYLSGGSTPPQKFSLDSPDDKVQMYSTPDQKSTAEKVSSSCSTPELRPIIEKPKNILNESRDSTYLLSLTSSSPSSSFNLSGLKRKLGAEVCSNSSSKYMKQRRDSEASRDSGLGSIGSPGGLESDLYKTRVIVDQERTKGGKRTTDLCAQPLDDLWGGSLLPLLPESTKIHERGADLSFDIELDDIDLDQLDKEEPDDCVDAIVITNNRFQQAVTEGDYQLVRKALNSSKKYDVEAIDELGITLLMYSAQNGYDDIAELLVSNGADVNAQQKNGTTSLMLACEHAHICTVALLVELGASVNLQQDNGETALMKAVKRGHKQIVKFLLEYGANFSAQNSSGFTAVTYAKMLRLTEIEDVIVEHISRLTKEFDKQVLITLNNTAKITSALFPLQVFPLCEGEKFVINFKHDFQPIMPGIGHLLFVAHARITATDCKCRFYGPCAVTSATLNGATQPQLTDEGNFVLSCCPLQNGRNEIVINTVKAPISKAKLVISAYRCQLID